MTKEPAVNLIALVAEGKKGLAARRIVLEQELQRELGTMFATQSVQLVDANLSRIEFDAGYNPDDEEVFIIKGFSLPKVIQAATASIATLDALLLSESDPPSIKTIIAVEQKPNAQPKLYFQQFVQSRIIRPKWTLMFKKDRFEACQNSGLSLDTKIVAMHVEGDLLFRNFRSVNVFLDLTDYFREATEAEIITFLGHSVFSAENPQRIARRAPQWMKKRVAMLSESKVLDTISVSHLKVVAARHDVKIETKNESGVEKIVFPMDKTAAKSLLQFLNEERYRGPLSDRVFETNSKRPAE